MRIPEKYKKWLTVKAWYNCFRVSAALIVTAGLLEFAHAILFNAIDPVLKGLYVVIMAFVFSLIIWGLAFLSPELIETIFAMLGYKEDEKKKLSRT
jgi:thiosulfate reductase cytochrome b subunit